jgi:hypothetical protein
VLLGFFPVVDVVAVQALLSSGVEQADTAALETAARLLAGEFLG